MGLFKQEGGEEKKGRRKRQGGGARGWKNGVGGKGEGSSEKISFLEDFFWGGYVRMYVHPYCTVKRRWYDEYEYECEK